MTLIGLINLTLVFNGVYESIKVIYVFAVIHIVFFTLILLAKQKYLLALLTIFGIALADMRFIKEQLISTKLYSLDFQADMAKFALKLNEVTKDGFKFGVFWAGTIPYYTKGQAIDFLGKCDKYISSMKPHKTPSWSGMNGVPGHSKYNLDYSIKKLQPDWIQDYKYSNENLIDYAKENYVKLSYKDYEMMGCFKKNSLNIDWSKVQINDNCE